MSKQILKQAIAVNDESGMFEMMGMGNAIVTPACLAMIIIYVQI